MARMCGTGPNRTAVPHILYSKKMAEETKLKTLKQIECKICKKQITKLPKLSNNQWGKREYCSAKCRQKGRSKDMKGKQIKKDNPNWKGNNATITAFHKRIERLSGKPNICAICKTTDKNKTYDWACLTGKYEDISDYKRLCRSCHKKYDLARLGKGLITLKELPLLKRDKEILSLMAVKWVKNANEIVAHSNETNYPLERGWIFDDIDDFIKHFFNLTEDDLK